MRTFGTAVLKGGSWHIDAEPHVLMRLKRIFGRVRLQFGTIVIKDSDEVCRDLLWFIERFPLDVVPHEHMVQRSDAHIARAERFVSVLEGSISPIPFQLAIPARDYQLVAGSLILETEGLLIADDLGVGKTVSAICPLMDPRTRPALIVTLTHLPTQWQRELGRFAPQLHTHILKKGSPYDLTRGGKDPQPDVLISNYHKLSGWADELAGKIRYVVFDEVQELRRGDASAKGKAAQHIAEGAKWRGGLSGTPIYGFGGEFYNVMQALRPGSLGTRDEFLREWCGERGFDDNTARIREPKAFGTYLRESGLMIRRTRADVKRELPPLTQVVQHVNADMAALDAVADRAAELAKLILGKDIHGFDKAQAAEELSWRMRQATGVAKAHFAAEFIKLLAESGERILCFAWHREVYALLQARLKPLRTALFTGTESPKQKETARDDFINGKIDVLLMSLRAGAGLDGLQACCRTVVYAEPDWSSGVMEQTLGRILRDGQTEPVAAYYLRSDFGSDPAVYDSIGLKQAQMAGIRDPNASLVEKLEADTERIKSLARDYLRQRGISPP